MIIHLIDGTYELFRHYYGLRRLSSKGMPFGAVAGVLGTVIQMLEGGATHIGVATDHIIESFRNELWPGYKTGLGIEPALHAQFVPLEKALVAMGVATWPMVELEADDALASAAYIAAQEETGDAAYRRAALHRRRGAALARSDGRVRWRSRADRCTGPHDANRQIDAHAVRWPVFWPCWRSARREWANWRADGATPPAQKTWQTGKLNFFRDTSPYIRR